MRHNPEGFLKIDVIFEYVAMRHNPEYIVLLAMRHNPEGGIILLNVTLVLLETVQKCITSNPQ